MKPLLDQFDRRREVWFGEHQLPSPARPVRFATTATTLETRVEALSDMLGLEQPAHVVDEPASFARANLHIMVLTASAALEAPYSHLTNIAARSTCATIAALDNMPTALYDDGACGIVYVTFPDDATRVVEAINALFPHFRAAAYTGLGKSAVKAQERAQQNKEALDALAAGEVFWLVANAAFGLGIDFKRIIRFVLHSGRFPPSPADLAQEMGRAGRDGSPAWCVTYLSAPLVVQTAALVASPPDESEDLEPHHLASAQAALDSICAVLALLLKPGCRRWALLATTVGSSLADGCLPCSTCDRCATPDVCCLTRGHERSIDLDASALALFDALRRRPLTTFDASLSAHKWRCLPPAFNSSFSTGHLILVMLAHGVLGLAARPGKLSSSKAWRRERVLLTINTARLDADGGCGLRDVPFGAELGAPLSQPPMQAELTQRLREYHEALRKQEAVENRTARCRTAVLQAAREARRWDLVDRILNEQSCLPRVTPDPASIRHVSPL